MCVACHPEKPAVIAAGSFNGEVYVWNTGAEEQLIACTKIDDYFHREPIAKVHAYPLFIVFRPCSLCVFY